MPRARRLSGVARGVRGVRGTVANVALVAFLVGAVWALWPSNLGGCTTMTIVSGHSMEPTYYTGDLVVSRCGEAAVGDVVVYQPARENGGRVIHRIVGGDAEAGWRMQGDNNDFIDPWAPTEDEVLGVARLHVPHLGAVAAVLLAPLTWMSVLVLAAAVLMWPSRRGTTSTDESDSVPDDGLTR